MTKKLEKKLNHDLKLSSLNTWNKLRDEKMMATSKPATTCVYVTKARVAARIGSEKAIATLKK